MTTFQFPAIGTHWQVDIDTPINLTKKSELLNVIKERIELFDKTYSRFRTDSLVYRASQKAGTYIFPSDFIPLISLYDNLYKITDGEVTPLIGNVLSDAGYDAEYSLKTKKLHKPKNWKDVLEVRGQSLTVKSPVILDFGAAGKGYLIGIIGKLLEENNINSFCIDAGGDILTKQDKPLRVGLENPIDTKQVIGVIPIHNQSICASAGNRRKWGNFHHIINPKTLKPIEHILSTWIVADTALLADGLATAIFFTPPKILQMYYNFEYLLLFPDFTIEKSAGFAAEFF